jgi:phage shock protein C
MSILRRRLYRSKEDRMISGVLGGAAEYFGGIDPTLVRLVFVFLTIVTGFVPGIAVYILAMIIVPDKPSEERAEPPVAASVADESA